MCYAYICMNCYFLWCVWMLRFLWGWNRCYCCFILQSCYSLWCVWALRFLWEFSQCWCRQWLFLTSLGRLCLHCYLRGYQERCHSLWIVWSVLLLWDLCARVRKKQWIGLLIVIAFKTFAKDYPYFSICNLCLL